MKKIIHQSTETKIIIDGQEYDKFEDLPEDLQKELQEQGLRNLDSIMEQAQGNKQTKVLNSKFHIPKDSMVMMVVFLLIILTSFILQYFGIFS
jgi:hypothetical protein